MMLGQQMALMALRALGVSAAAWAADGEPKVVTVTAEVQAEANGQAAAKPEVEVVEVKGDKPQTITVIGRTITVEENGDEKPAAKGEGVKEEVRKSIRAEVRVVTPDGKTLRYSPEGLSGLLKEAEGLAEMKAKLAKQKALTELQVKGSNIMILRSSEGELKEVPLGDVTTVLGKLSASVNGSLEIEAPRFQLGVLVKEAPPAALAQAGIDEQPAVVVDAVVDDGPAAKAGVKKFDLILKAAGEPMKSPDDLTKVIKTSEGKSITLSLVRKGEDVTIEVTPREIGAPKPPVRPEHVIQFGPGVMMPQGQFNWTTAGPGETAALKKEIQALRKDISELKKMVSELKETDKD